MDHIKAVLFDLDNTILDRTQTFHRFARSLVETYFHHLDATQAICDTIIDLDQDGYKDKTELFSQLIDELPWRAKPQLSELLQFYQSEYIRNAILMEQAQDILLYARKKYKTGLITNGRIAIQYGKIDQLGIREAFDVILVSEEAGARKPDPRIFQMALNKLKLRPEECIFIGDHPVNDVEGAAKAGMETIWIKVNQPWREELSAKPLYAINRLSELLAII